MEEGERTISTYRQTHEHIQLLSVDIEVEMLAGDMLIASRFLPSTQPRCPCQLPFSLANNSSLYFMAAYILYSYIFIFSNYLLIDYIFLYFISDSKSSQNQTIWTIVWYSWKLFHKNSIIHFYSIPKSFSFIIETYLYRSYYYFILYTVMLLLMLI